MNRELHRRGTSLRDVGASEKLRAVVARAVDHACDLHTTFDWSVKDEVVANGQEAQIACEIRPCLAGVRLRCENLESLLYRVEPAVGGPHVEGADVAPDFIKVALRRTRDAVETHATDFLRVLSCSRPRAFTPSKNERSSASSLHSTHSPRSS